MITVRCKNCNRELTTKAKPQCCGCPNQMRLDGDKVSAIDLNKVVMVSYDRGKKTDSHFSHEDLAYQESRRKRKVRKLDFDVR